MEKENVQELSSVKRALHAIQALQSKLEAVEYAQREPIAIVGVGCRFPGGVQTPEEYWELLCHGKDAITEIPANRWPVDQFYHPDPETSGKMYTRYGGFIDDVDKFDAPFFGISTREALCLDPQQRLLLEVTWEALERAAINPQQLEKTKTGVFVGISNHDYVGRFADRLEDITPYVGSGNSHSTAVGRLSFFLGLTGPNLAIDTACSSSLIAVHTACQSLRQGESDLAISGGVNLLLAPGTHINHSRARMLAPDGRCKAFDSRADGFVRSEGCGVVILKRLSQALTEGDRIWAVLRGSAINQDGRTSGLTVPSGPSQQTVIRQALANGQISPSQISYIEAHGTGTALGDPIEMGALDAVFKQSHSQQQPLNVGSVKTNIGHAEAAAGIAGLIKVVLQLQHKEIAPHLHFCQPNPYIDWENVAISVPQGRTPWSEGEHPRMAGVSSFGFSGSNAHIIVSELSTTEVASSQASTSSPAAHTSPSPPLQILKLSARTKTGLQALAQRYCQYLNCYPDSDLADVCYTANTGRADFNHRLAILAPSKTDLIAKLNQLDNHQETPIVHLYRGQVTRQTEPKIAFLFTGQGSQSVDMGRQLYETVPLFRQTLHQCDQLLQPYLEQPLLDILYPSDHSAANLLHKTAYTQPALFALEYALYQVWNSWGVLPTVVMGHSVGEYVAACVAGVFSLADGLKLIAARGRLMQQLLTEGKMVSLMASQVTVEEAIQACEVSELSIAAVNGPQSIVISGPDSEIDTVVAILTQQGIKVTGLQVSHAFHSGLMAPMVDAFKQVAQQVDYTQPQLKLVSNVTGTVATAEIATPDYWCRHVLAPVKFYQGMKTLSALEISTFVECGPKPILLGMGRSCISEDTGVWLPSLRPNQENWATMGASLGQLYVRGVEVDWDGLGRPHQKVDLPTYPFQRQSYWTEATTNGREAPAATLPALPIIDLLNQGDSDKLTQLLGKNSADHREVITSLVQEYQRQLTLATSENWFYTVNWQPQPFLPDRAVVASGDWLIFADKLGVGTVLAEKLTQQSHQCTLVSAQTATDDLNGIEQGICEYRGLQPGDAEAMESLIKSWLSSDRSPRGIVYLWGLDARTTAEMPTDSLEQGITYSCQNLLHLIQSLAKHQTPDCRFWGVTHNAVTSETPATALAQAPLWGLGKVIALEHSDLWGGLIDLAPTLPVATQAQLICQEIGQRLPTDDQVAYDASGRSVARLQNHPSPPIQTLSPDQIGSYLITGGLGGLGLQVAQWLASQGVKQLVLTGRQIDRPDTEAALTALEQTGTRVKVMAADVTSQAAMARVMKTIETSLPPLKGVIHIAGVLDDGILLSQTWESFSRVMAPKVQGTWILHQLTKTLPLDFFICFSSISALMGAPGQANYAAANAFMDAFATYRQTLDLPGLSLNWGPWSQQGMAARLESDYQNRIAAVGFRPFSDAQGIQLLSQVLQQQRQLGIVSIDWDTWLDQFSGRQRDYFSTVQTQKTGQHNLSQRQGDLDVIVASQPEQAPLDMLRTMPTAEQYAFLVDYFSREIGQALLLTPEEVDKDEFLTLMGFDSLMSLELRNRLRTHLGVDISVTQLIEGISIHTLATIVQQKLSQLLDPYEAVELNGTTEPQAVMSGVVDGQEWFSEGEL
ncbi:type I polyketide synthase [Leptothoe sp. EHU-05/26/07-4]